MWYASASLWMLTMDVKIDQECLTVLKWENATNLGPPLLTIINGITQRVMTGPTVLFQMECFVAIDARGELFGIHPNYCLT